MLHLEQMMPTVRNRNLEYSFPHDFAGCVKVKATAFDYCPPANFRTLEVSFEILWKNN